MDALFIYVWLSASEAGHSFITSWADSKIGRGRHPDVVIEMEVSSITDGESGEIELPLLSSGSLSEQHRDRSSACLYGIQTDST